MATSTIKRPTGKFIQSGSITFTNVSTSVSTKQIAFDIPFNSVPNVVVYMTTNYNRNVDVTNITTTGFTANASLNSGTGSASVWAQWVAVGN